MRRRVRPVGAHPIRIILADFTNALPYSDICGVNPIPGDRFRCNSCYTFEICQSCHDQKAPPPATLLSHKPSHKFTRIAVATEEAGT